MGSAGVSNDWSSYTLELNNKECLHGARISQTAMSPAEHENSACLKYNSCENRASQGRSVASSCF